MWGLSDSRKHQGKDKAIISKRENERFYIILTLKIKRKNCISPLFIPSVPTALICLQTIGENSLKKYINQALFDFLKLPSASTISADLYQDFLSVSVRHIAPGLCYILNNNDLCSAFLFVIKVRTVTLIAERPLRVMGKISHHQTCEVGIVCWFSFPPLSLAAHFSDLSLPSSAPSCVLCQLIQGWRHSRSISKPRCNRSFSLWLALPLWQPRYLFRPETNGLNADHCTLLYLTQTQCRLSLNVLL